MRSLRRLLSSQATVGRSVRVALILLFLWLVARHAHPHYGFTRFLQADTAVAAKMIPVLEAAPLYIHSDPGSYDGFFYAQIATDPTLRAPELRTAIDDLGYRARRILLPIFAWLVGAGEPIAAVRAYAWLNIAVWLALAVTLWRLFPADDGRATLAWAGLLFAAGALLSVRLALPDLPALLFTTLAAMAIERNHAGHATGALALAGLSRETALLGLAAFWPPPGHSWSARARAIAWSIAAAAPTVLWLLYIRATVGSSSAGLRNFSWPFVAFAEKIRATVSLWPTEPNRLLVVGTLGCLIALITQLFFIVLHPRRDDPWWRIGAIYSVLLACLGPAVWGDDLPGAAVRVLLPLGLAFNLLVVRSRASWLWLLLGNLWALAGWAHLATAAPDAHELSAGNRETMSYVVRTDTHWYPAESRAQNRWAWTAHGGALTIDTWPHSTRLARVSLVISPFSPREIEISASGQSLWRGALTGRSEMRLPPLHPVGGRVTFEVRSSAPAERESAATHARELGFSISDVRLE